MNCFEARQKFAALWRNELGPERRAALLEHMRGCHPCDGAFRTFALTAPVLHSIREPERDLAEYRARRRAAHQVTGARRAGWLSMSAAVVVFVAGALAAYLSVTAPVTSLTDELTQPEPVVETFGADVQGADSDFAG